MNAAFKLMQGMGLTNPAKHMEFVNKLNSITAVGEAGAGMVKATMNAHGKLVKVDIDNKLMQKDKKIIEDLVLVACNNARDLSLQAGAEYFAQMQGETPDSMQMMQALMNGMNNTKPQ